MFMTRCLAGLLAWALALPAQQAAPAASSPATQSSGLKIVVLQGEGATNQIQSRLATAPVVEVRDAADKPVAGAEVVFQLPLSGPSGFFNGWLKNQTVRTGSDGRAAATGYTPNDVEGRLEIKVTATRGSDTASAVITQTNVPGRPGPGPRASSSRSGMWKVLAIIGGAAIAGGIAAAARNGDTATPATPKVVTVTAGAVTVGGPR